MSPRIQVIFPKRKTKVRKGLSWTDKLKYIPCKNQNGFEKKEKSNVPRLRKG